MDKETLLSKMSEDTKQYADRVMAMYEAPFARMIGLEIESIKGDEIVCSLELKDDLMNSMGRAHGGVIFSLMDHTSAILSNLYNDGTGQSCEIKYYRPATGKLRCVAKTINLSRSIGVNEVRTYSEEGKLVASAVCTSFNMRRD